MAKEKKWKIPPSVRARMPQVWKKGESGNPSGMTSAVAIQIRNNAKRATHIREKFLTTLQSQIATNEVLADMEESGTLDERNQRKQRRILDLLGPDVNRLLRDSEDRGFGAPKQSVEVDDQRQKRLEDMTDAELEAVVMGGDEDPDAGDGADEDGEQG